MCYQSGRIVFRLSWQCISARQKQFLLPHISVTLEHWLLTIETASGLEATETESRRLVFLQDHAHPQNIGLQSASSWLEETRGRWLLYSPICYVCIVPLSVLNTYEGNWTSYAGRSRLTNDADCDAKNVLGLVRQSGIKDVVTCDMTPRNLFLVSMSLFTKVYKIFYWSHISEGRTNSTTGRT